MGEPGRRRAGDADRGPSLHEAYLLANGLPAAARVPIQQDATAYAHYVQTVEWPLLQHGAAVPDTGWTMLAKLHAAVASYNPATSAQDITASAILNQLSAVDAARTGRLDAAGSRMPAMLWVGLCLGGVLTVGLTFAYSMERQLGHTTLIMSLTSLIGFMMILLLIINNPFSAGFGATPADFADAFPIH